MRAICGYCANIGKPICKECNWMNTRYPTNYAGKHFPTGALKLLERPLGEN